MLLLCFHGVLGQEDDLELKFLEDVDKPVYAEEGSSLEFTCQVNRDLMFFISNSVSWTHELTWNNETKSSVIGSNADLKAPYDSEHYLLAFHAHEGGKLVDFTFSLKNVTRKDDGRLICGATVQSGLDKIERHAFVDIIVTKPLDVFAMKFASYPIITHEPETPLEVNAGETYKLGCNAEGSNPRVDDLKVFLGDHQLNLSTAMPMPMQTEYRQYQTNVGGEITILTDHDLKYLSCEAHGDHVEAHLQVQLKVITYDPEISCSEGEGYITKKFVELKCTVNTTGVNVEKTYFRLADVGKNLFEGDGSFEKHNFKVDKKPLGADVFEFKMTIEQAQEWHFTQNLLIVVESAGNHVTEERLKLNKIPGAKVFIPDLKDPSEQKEVPEDNGNNKSSRMAISLATVISCILCIFALA